jgi:hypothetical protein
MLHMVKLVTVVQFGLLVDSRGEVRYSNSECLSIQNELVNPHVQLDRL